MAAHDALFFALVLFSVIRVNGDDIAERCKFLVDKNCVDNSKVPKCIGVPIFVRCGVNLVGEAYKLNCNQDAKNKIKARLNALQNIDSVICFNETLRKIFQFHSSCWTSVANCVVDAIAKPFLDTEYYENIDIDCKNADLTLHSCVAQMENVCKTVTKKLIDAMMETLPCSLDVGVCNIFPHDNCLEDHVVSCSTSTKNYIVNCGENLINSSNMCSEEVKNTAEAIFKLLQCIDQIVCNEKMLQNIFTSKICWESVASCTVDNMLLLHQSTNVSQEIYCRNTLSLIGACATTNINKCGNDVIKIFSDVIKKQISCGSCITVKVNVSLILFSIFTMLKFF